MTKMGKGYTGKILLVDLTTKQSETITLDDDIYRAFIGGHGLASRILFDPFFQRQQHRAEYLCHTDKIEG